MLGGLRRAGQNIEVGDGDGVQRGAAARDEAGDRKLAAARHHCHERCAFAEQIASTGHLEGHQRLHGGAGVRGAKVVVAHGEPAKVFLGQIDAAAVQILCDVLPVLGQLQRGADLVGERDAIGGGDAEGGEHQVPDRVGRQRAVVPQVVERLVAVGALVEPVGLDESAQWRLGDPARAHACRQRSHRRHAGIAAGEQRRDVGIDEVEHGKAHAALDAVLIADVVDEPGVAVDRQQVGAQLFRQEPQGDRKVLGSRLREHPVKRLEDRRGCGHRASILLLLIDCGIQPYDEGYEYRARRGGAPRGRCQAGSPVGDYRLGRSGEPDGVRHARLPEAVRLPEGARPRS